MKNSIFNWTALPAILGIIMVLPKPLQAAEYTLSMPHFLGQPGDEVEVPLTIDNGTGYARVRAQINYDPQVAELLSVTSEPLGDHFEMLTTTEEGWVTLDFLRTEDLAEQPGHLARLKFRLNPGATTDLYSDLSIAKFEIGDSTGVVALSLENNLAIQNGSITVSLDNNIDNGSNGLPDWWERQYGFDPFIDNVGLDPEKDGRNNLLEYVFGSNPTAADTSARGPNMNFIDEDGSTYMSISFYRRKDMPGHQLFVQESAELSSWYDLSIPTQMRGAPQDMGDGTERVEVMGTRAMSGPSAVSKGFLRLNVQSN